MLSSDPGGTAPALTDAGKAFQARAAATEKARSPSVTRLVDDDVDYYCFYSRRPESRE